MLKERCQDIIDGKAPSIINKIVTRMKQKKGQHPMAFYKDNILQYHNEQAKINATQTSHFEIKAHNRRQSDQYSSEGSESKSIDNRNAIAGRGHITNSEFNKTNMK